MSDVTCELHNSLTQGFPSTLCAMVYCAVLVMWPVHRIHRPHVTMEMLDGYIILSQKVKVEQVSTQQGTVGCLDVDF